MISHVKGAAVHSVAKQTNDNRFEQIRKAAAEKRGKSDTAGAPRQARQTAANNRML